MKKYLRQAVILLHFFCLSGKKEIGAKRADRTVLEIKMHQIFDVSLENLFLLPACDF